MKSGSALPMVTPQVNHLLAALDEESLRRLLPHLQPVLLKAKQVLYHAGSHIHHVYLPETAVLCMLAHMEDGRSVESMTVGREGAAWVSASLDAPRMPCQTITAIGGRAQRIAVRYLEEESQRNGSLHRVLMQYSHALLIQAMRTGACNALHSLEQRCSRWMLETVDRTDVDSFAVTHDFLSSLIGCGRPVLTLILQQMEAAGAVGLHRGLIRIHNRSTLEELACECYNVIREGHTQESITVNE